MFRDVLSLSTIHQESIPSLAPLKRFVSTSRTHLCISLLSSSHSARTFCRPAILLAQRFVVATRHSR